MKHSVQPVTSAVAARAARSLLSCHRSATSCSSRARPDATRSTKALAGTDVEAQTEQTLEEHRGDSRGGRIGSSHVLRCGVFLVDIAEFPRMNEVYARMFGAHRPARTTVQVSALPGEGLRVEIDAIAVIPEG